MNADGRIIGDMIKFLDLFASRCEDRTTLDELRRMAADRQLWTKGHDLFSRVRNKTLVAERTRDRRSSAQYLFEEVCAKTLYNLSGSRAPFDPDSPYWIVPNAFALARALGIHDSEILGVVAI